MMSGHLAFPPGLPRRLLAPLAALALAACATQPAPLPSASAAMSSALSGYVDRKLGAFAAADAVRRPGPESIILVGSSIFDFWPDPAADLAPLPVVNRAIAATRSWDQLALADRTALSYRPRVIVLYAGSNDFKSGGSAAGVAANLAGYAARVRKASPRSDLILTSILRAPEKRDRWAEVDAANRAVAALAARDPQIHYVDLNPAVESAPGQPLAALYLPDQLHYRPSAYPRFAARLRPVIERILDAR